MVVMRINDATLNHATTSNDHQVVLQFYLHSQLFKFLLKTFRAVAFLVQETVHPFNDGSSFAVSCQRYQWREQVRTISCIKMKCFQFSRPDQNFMVTDA